MLIILVVGREAGGRQLGQCDCLDASVVRVNLALWLSAV